LQGKENNVKNKICGIKSAYEKSDLDYCPEGLKGELCPFCQERTITRKIC